VSILSLLLLLLLLLPLQLCCEELVSCCCTGSNVSSAQQVWRQLLPATPHQLSAMTGGSRGHYRR
jgi:hypothetical protein